MKSLRRTGIKIGAPAVVMLAAVVNSAVAGGQPLAETAVTRPDLTWAVRGGATHSVSSARAYLAAKAVRTIHSLDRIQCALVPISTGVHAVDSRDSSTARAVAQPARALQHICSSHQHSAP